MVLNWIMHLDSSPTETQITQKFRSFVVFYKPK